MIRQHRITVALTLGLALTASAAPAASADPPPLATAEAAIAANGGTTAVVQPNPDQRTAITAPTSSSALRTAVIVRPNPDQQPRALTPVSVDHSPARAPATVVHVVAPGGRLDWGDAGIGAAGGFLLSLLGVGSVIAISRRRTRHGQAAHAS
jgi:hypothetical protein